MSKVALFDTDDLAHTLYTYTVHNKDACTLEIQFDFTQAFNLEIEGKPDRVFTVSIGPLQKDIVAFARAFDTEWNTECEVRVLKRSSELAREIICESVRKIEEEIERAKADWEHCLTIEEYRQRLKAKGKAYIDVEFPPTEEAVKGLLDAVVEWRRPWKKSVMFGIDHGLKRGELDDEWFISTVKCIPNHLLRELFISQDVASDGFYQIRLYKNGE